MRVEVNSARYVEIEFLGTGNILLLTKDQARELEQKLHQVSVENFDENKTLLPCPFCGSQESRIDKCYFTDVYFVVCENNECNAEGPCDKTIEGAIAKWEKANE